MNFYSLNFSVILLLAPSFGFSFVPNRRKYHDGIIRRSRSFGIRRTCSCRRQQQRFSRFLSPAPTERYATSDNVDEIEEEEFDEDEYEGTDKTYEEYVSELQALSQTKQTNPEAPAQAEAVFDDMFGAYMMEDDAALFPNVQSYIAVMEGYANRNQPEQAVAVFERLQDRFDKTKQPDFQPDTKAYNQLIKAWMKSTSPHKTEKANSLLEHMIASYKEAPESSVIKPNAKSFVQVMRCCKDDCIDFVQQKMEQMKQLHEEYPDEPDFEPNAYCYNELLHTMTGAAEMEAILYDLMAQYNQQNKPALKPNDVTFRLVIQAYRGNSRPAVAKKVEQLLNLQKSIGVSISERTYATAIQAIARTNHVDKVQLAYRLLEEMKETSEQHSEILAVKAYNGVLNACAHPAGKPENPKEIFSTAINILNEVREKHLADTTTYGYVLQSCARLLPGPHEKRDQVVEIVFKKACRDGQVGRFVLSELMTVASPELAARLLGGDPANGIKIPRKWSQNVASKRQLLRK